jgi:ketohexokinase
MARILAIGIAAVDIINVVDGYPPEDAEVRALDQRIARGGNATNTLVILSQLGHRCAWAGVLTDEPDARRITEDLVRYRIDTAACRRVDHGRMPVSYITVNRRNGSRTIIHYRDLPEYRFDDFTTLDLSGFDWLHFEGRAIDETQRMLTHAANVQPQARRSLEVEKPRPGIEALFPLAQVIIFSRAYAEARGYGSPEALFNGLGGPAPGTLWICTWGEAGAWAGTSGEVIHCPAYPPHETVDTLGAGDTFNAGLIDALIRGLPLDAALESAARLAGRKCGQSGFAGLGPGGD